MKRDWKKERASAAKHARLVARKPELREQLYGRPTQEERQLARDIINAVAPATGQKANDNG